ncbi:MAG: S-layer homology domain-containing protein [Oscillospiraceae bacterium]|nr:S-layer homology domain-containing protein [Oscillospiraceae bacterium]
MKRNAVASIISLLFIFTLTASASLAGSADNPLITLSYLEGAFLKSVESEMRDILGNVENDAENALNTLLGQFDSYSFTPSFLRLTLSQGDAVQIPFGASLILHSGSASIIIESGTVVNITTGQEVESGTAVQLSQRYFSTEDTIAKVVIMESSTALVDGYYLVSADSQNKPHAVFRDVREKDWYYQAVDYVFERGLFQGTSNIAFSPGLTMTRGMFVTVLYRMDGEPEATNELEFSDVQDTQLYYYNASNWASENNIVLGYNDMTFRPNAPITREQMAAILYRYSAYRGGDVTIEGLGFMLFPDAGDISEYAIAAMSWAVARGIINGSNGKLLPNSPATRAQVAQIIYNINTVSN